LGRSERLPRIPLQGGGEFCVVKICYGPSEVHRLGGSPRVVLELWDRLPHSLQTRLPAPTYGDTALVPRPNRNALSIYWTWIDPKTGKHELGPSGDVIMTMDSGEQVNLKWPDPFDDYKGAGYRQIFVDEPREIRAFSASMCRWKMRRWTLLSPTRHSGSLSASRNGGSAAVQR
jgi:hypothetical protein